MSLLKIVLFAVVIAVTVGLAIEFLIEPHKLYGHFINYIISLITTVFGAFSWVTIIFAVVEYFGIKVSHISLEKSGHWRPEHLSAVPDRKKQIKRIEPILGIIFSIIGLILFVSFSHYIGAFIYVNGNLTIVPILNKAVISNYLPIIIIGFGLIILKDCLKFTTGKWTMKLVGAISLINLMTLFILFFILKDTAIWNASFVEELVQTGSIIPGAEDFSMMTFIWERATMIVLAIMIFTLLFDSINGFLKARK